MNSIKPFYGGRNHKKVFIVGDFNLSTASWPGQRYEQPHLSLTLSDFIWSDIKWALEALAPILKSARIKSDHLKSAHSKVRQNFLVEKYF